MRHVRRHHLAQFQVVILRHIREALKVQPGQKVQAFEYEGRVEFVPVRSAKALLGFLRRFLRWFLRGIDTAVPRERDRK